MNRDKNLAFSLPVFPSLIPRYIIGIHFNIVWSVFSTWEIRWTEYICDSLYELGIVNKIWFLQAAYLATQQMKKNVRQKWRCNVISWIKKTRYKLYHNRSRTGLSIYHDYSWSACDQTEPSAVFEKKWMLKLIIYLSWKK